MKIGLIDVDGHNFPNLALMRVSAWHKSIGDTVKWWWSDFLYYDKVYMSRVFNDTYSRDKAEPLNVGSIHKGGTGYCIETVDGCEIYRPQHDAKLPDYIERMRPDYSIYTQYDFAVAMTSRGCPRNCPFCHVTAKEGRRTVKVADVQDFYEGQKLIKVLDANLTACPQKRELFAQYIETGVEIDFTQGLDIRLLDDADIDDVNRMRIAGMHFAWDDAKTDLRGQFKRYAEQAKHKPNGSYGTVYVLTNFDSTLEENLYRVYTLRDMKYDPYVMIYNKPNAPKEIRRLQRWCNNRKIFKSCKDFRDYTG